MARMPRAIQTTLLSKPQQSLEDHFAGPGRKTLILPHSALSALPFRPNVVRWIVGSEDFATGITSRPIP